jgi:uncharacterized membrane protein YqhA
MVLKLVSATRFLVIIPIIGLALTASVLFVLAGFGLIAFIVESALELFSGHAEELIPIIQLVEFVHQFLVGTGSPCPAGCRSTAPTSWRAA